MPDVFKAAASRANEIQAAVMPFDVNKEHLSLTVDSNLVYFAGPHTYNNEERGSELGVWSLGGQRKTIDERFNSEDFG